MRAVQQYRDSVMLIALLRHRQGQMGDEIKVRPTLPGCYETPRNRVAPSQRRKALPLPSSYRLYTSYSMTSNRSCSSRCSGTGRARWPMTSRSVPPPAAAAGEEGWFDGERSIKEQTMKRLFSCMLILGSGGQDNGLPAFQEEYRDQDYQVSKSRGDRRTWRPRSRLRKWRAWSRRCWSSASCSCASRSRATTRTYSAPRAW
jgi:hypothetical protein